MEICGTLDEAWVDLKDYNKRSIFCCPTEGYDYAKWLRQCTEKFPKKLTIVAGFGYNGKLKVKKVSRKANIYSLYYPQNILRSIFGKETPILYGKEIDKVDINMDKAFNCMSKSTAADLAKKEPETGITCIPTEEIPVISTGASPMDFCAFSLLKRASGKRPPRTLNRLWKTVQEQWKQIAITVLRKNLLSRKYSSCSCNPGF
ncbi:uncharacterized protein TNCV_4036701 [Trichonephila clavipes]|nr:uncharacterized protein TNCV_4036701 [Trichonephila clavipes]